MPEVDGSEVCRAVRGHQNDSYVYILMLTSKQSTEDLVAALEAGADDYLTKPFKPAELSARLLTGQRILSLEEKLVQAREGMRFRATHDGLTGLLNRASVLTRVQHALDKLQRDEEPFALLLCDVDHFKMVNDVHGHNAGDAVLQEIGARLRGLVQESGCVGRYGGEEYLIKLGGCGPQSIAERAEEVRRVVHDKPIEVPGGLLSTSVSVGAVAVAKEHHGMALGEIIEHADKGLYAAKAQGRNCVRIQQLPPFRKSLSSAIHRVAHLGKQGGAMASLAERLRYPTLTKPHGADYMERAKA